MEDQAFQEMVTRWHVAEKVAYLAKIPKVNWGMPRPGEFKICLHNASTLNPIDSVDFKGADDERSVNEVAARQSFGRDRVVVVSDHEGNATAAYINGEKVA